MLLQGLVGDGNKGGRVEVWQPQLENDRPRENVTGLEDTSLQLFV